ncbi:MAG: hypothetical protein PGN34_26505 [Methylobacterium frigidaeris]
MDHAPPVGGGEAGEEMGQGGPGQGAAGEVRVAAQHDVEGVADEVLHHHEGVGAVPVEVVDGDDVGVSERLGVARLRLQRPRRRPVADPARGEQLDRDVGRDAVELLAAAVDGAVDHSHATLADLGIKDEAAPQDLPDSPSGGIRGGRRRMPQGAKPRGHAVDLRRIGAVAG